MGRMFETLKQAGAVRSNVVEGATVRQDCVVDWSLRETEEVPFIEVGDGKNVEGSPRVMAASPKQRQPATQSAVQPPHPPTEKSLSQAKATATAVAAHAIAAPAIALTATKPMKVSFEAWPATSTGRG